MMRQIPCNRVPAFEAWEMWSLECDVVRCSGLDRAVRPPVGYAARSLLISHLCHSSWKTLFISVRDVPRHHMAFSRHSWSESCSIVQSGRRLIYLDLDFI